MRTIKFGCAVLLCTLVHGMPMTARADGLRVSGTTLDLSGKPQPGVQVRLGAQSTESDSLGAWSFGGSAGIGPVSDAAPRAHGGMLPRFEAGAGAGVRLGSWDAQGRRSSLRGDLPRPSTVAARGLALPETVQVIWNQKVLFRIPVSKDTILAGLRLDTAWDHDHGVPWNPKIRYGSLRDPKDGRTYRTVAIGATTWMAQNYAREVPGSVCLADADSCAKYGRLYDWALSLDLPDSANRTFVGGTLSRTGICPTGWHVSTDDDWWNVTPIATGRHLCSTQGWKEAGGTDMVGFRALPAGYYGWQFESVGKGSFFGTQDESTFMGPTYTVNVQLSPTTDQTLGASFGKSNKQSIRCVRN